MHALQYAWKHLQFDLFIPIDHDLTNNIDRQTSSQPNIAPTGTICPEFLAESLLWPCEIPSLRTNDPLGSPNGHRKSALWLWQNTVTQLSGSRMAGTTALIKNIWRLYAYRNPISGLVYSLREVTNIGSFYPTLFTANTRNIQPPAQTPLPFSHLEGIRTGLQGCHIGQRSSYAAVDMADQGHPTKANNGYLGMCISYNIFNTF